MRENSCSGRVEEGERYQEKGQGRGLSEGRRVEREVNWEEREKDCGESIERNHWERRGEERGSGFYGNGQGGKTRDLGKGRKNCILMEFLISNWIWEICLRVCNSQQLIHWYTMLEKSTDKDRIGVLLGRYKNRALL